MLLVQGASLALRPGREGRDVKQGKEGQKGQHMRTALEETVARDGLLAHVLSCVQGAADGWAAALGVKGKVNVSRLYAEDHALITLQPRILNEAGI